MQRTLAAVQTGLACALLIAGFLLSISLWNLFTRPLGFQTQKRVALQVYLPQTTTAATAWQQAAPALRKLPQVASDAVSLRIPYNSIGLVYGRIYAKDGQSLGDHPAIIRAVAATGGFFKTLAIPLLHGNHFNGAGTTNARNVVISAALAKRLFGTTDVIGHTISAGISAGGNPRRIVGVTQNISWQPTARGDIAGTVYQTLFMGQQGAGGFIEVVAHIRGSSANAIPVIEHTLKQAIPGSAVYQAQTFDDLIRDGLALRAVAAGLIGAFAILALILATLGVFAVTAFIVRRRLGEYGIRAALGATPRRLLGTGLWDAARALIPGLVVGLVCAWLLERVMAPFLYHVSAAVIPVFVLGIVLIAVVTFVAALAPLARATGTPINRLLGR